jgi:hypothetical protein
VAIGGHDLGRPDGDRWSQNCRLDAGRGITVQPGLVLAWLYTGPLGHLVAGVWDWVALLARSLR